MSHSPSAASSDTLKAIFERLYQEVRSGVPPPARLRFYSYANLKHTVRFRGGVIRIRISDVLRQAPAEVLEVVIRILLYKLDAKPVPDRLQRTYRCYVQRPEIQQRLLQIRARRSRKRSSSPRGRCYDLAALYRSLNQRYFAGGLEVRQLGWHRHRLLRTLGDWDPARGAIVINPRLDHPLVPQYVVEFVLYHEMLHAALGERRCGQRSFHHHPRFRKAERRFVDYRRARLFLANDLP